MTYELTYLALAALLMFVQIVFQALNTIPAHGLKFLVGPRDGIEDKTVMSGRARRANANLIEGLAMFTPLVLIAHVTGENSTLTATGAALFFWGRVVFAITYWLGVPWVRTLAWGVSILGIFAIAWELFL